MCESASLWGRLRGRPLSVEMLPDPLPMESVRDKVYAKGQQLRLCVVFAALAL